MEDEKILDLSLSETIKSPQNTSKVVKPLNVSKNPSFKCKKIGPYILVKTIGQGTFGKVKLGIHLTTQLKVAIKILDKSKIKESIDIERINREIEILKKLRHKNIVQIFDTISSNNHIYLIMEYVEGTDLYDFISKKKTSDENYSCLLFQQLINSVEYIHRIGIAHRDIKPENIIVNEKTGQIKLVDFGLSNMYKDNDFLTTACGSPCYASPEMILGQAYDGLLSDIWSCGVVLYCMLCDRLPFDDTELKSLYKKITTASYKLPEHLSSKAKDLFKKIFQTNPNERIKIDEIKLHPWYKKQSQELDDGIQVLNDEIPVNVNVVNQVVRIFQGKHTKENIHSQISNNLHNNVTTTYYLLHKKHKKNESRNLNEDNFSRITSFLDIENISGINNYEQEEYDLNTNFNNFETEDVCSSNKYREKYDKYSNRLDKFNLLTLEKIENLERNFENLENLENFDNFKQINADFNRFTNFNDLTNFISNENDKNLIRKLGKRPTITNITNIQNNCNNFFDNKNLNVVVINNIHTAPSEKEKESKTTIGKNNKKIDFNKIDKKKINITLNTDILLKVNDDCKKKETSMAGRRVSVEKNAQRDVKDFDFDRECESDKDRIKDKDKEKEREKEKITEKDIRIKEKLTSEKCNVIPPNTSSLQKKPNIKFDIKIGSNVEKKEEKDKKVSVKTNIKSLINSRSSSINKTEAKKRDCSNANKKNPSKQTSVSPNMVLKSIKKSQTQTDTKRPNNSTFIINTCTNSSVVGIPSELTKRKTSHLKSNEVRKYKASNLNEDIGLNINLKINDTNITTEIKESNVDGGCVLDINKILENQSFQLENVSCGRFLDKSLNLNDSVNLTKFSIKNNFSEIFDGREGKEGKTENAKERDRDLRDKSSTNTGTNITTGGNQTTNSNCGNHYSNTEDERQQPTSTIQTNQLNQSSTQFKSQPSNSTTSKTIKVTRTIQKASASEKSPLPISKKVFFKDHKKQLKRLILNKGGDETSNLDSCKDVIDTSSNFIDEKINEITRNLQNLTVIQNMSKGGNKDESSPVKENKSNYSFLNVQSNDKKTIIKIKDLQSKLKLNKSNNNLSNIETKPRESKESSTSNNAKDSKDLRDVKDCKDGKPTEKPIFVKVIEKPKKIITSQNMNNLLGKLSVTPDSHPKTGERLKTATSNIKISRERKIQKK